MGTVSNAIGEVKTQGKRKDKSLLLGLNEDFMEEVEVTVFCSVSQCQCQVFTRRPGHYVS